MGVIANQIAIKKLARDGGKGTLNIYFDELSAKTEGAEGVTRISYNNFYDLLVVIIAEGEPDYFYYDKERTKPVDSKTVNENIYGLNIGVYTPVVGSTYLVSTVPILSVTAEISNTSNRTYIYLLTGKES